MRNVYLTGSTGGIGGAIARLLQEADYRIIPIRSRLEEVPALQEEVRQLLRDHPVDVLINAAGFGLFRPHEDIPVDTIASMIAVNLTAPIILAKLCLHTLKERNGQVVNISSVEATRHSRHSALYTATKSGLRHFSLTLFEEVRKAGVRVTSLNPGMTRTDFFDNLDFAPAADESCALSPQDVAQAVKQLLETDGVVVDFTIRPQRVGVRRKPHGEKAL